MPYLCLSSDVPLGTYRQLRLFGEDLLVARDSEGRLTLDRNACPHRGFPMARGVGKLPLRCAYHSLPFQPSGEFSVFEQWGCVWSMSIPELGANGELLERAAFGREFQKEELHVAAHWALWAQNTMDPNHVATTHPEFSRQLEDQARPFATWIAEDEVASSYRIPVRMDIARRWREALGVILGADFYHLFVYPHLSVTSFLGIFGSIETVESRAEETVVTTRFFLAPGIDLSAAALAASRCANRRILEEDRKIVEEWAKGRPVQTKPFVWLPGEERIKAFLRLLDEDRWGVTIL